MNNHPVLSLQSDSCNHKSGRGHIFWIRPAGGYVTNANRHGILWGFIRSHPSAFGWRTGLMKTTPVKLSALIAVGQQSPYHGALYAPYDNW